MKTYILNCDPLPLARPRLGKHKKMYNVQQEYRLVNGIHLQKQHNDAPLFEGPLHLDITFYLKMPHLSERKKDALENTFHYFKPDLSNLLKFVEDLANKIIYNDDAQISSIATRKLYARHPHTIFSISNLNKEKKYEENQKA